ncbi:TetR/AcrR family transcriptional regulator [Actinotalea sp. K2]|uniref:TetR/AcrR family transcriptional regulator n=1 Tax=Actinotalea sp. K2 TaxID=2939438 RepID=UPI002017DDC2|nr:TetR/AcrR family transcriptional regulator [Actinotalea sp. K2]MCL3861529.1 TetR/AcrR family transcriptional regulator [Actinotalea sp. K2]
MPKISEPTVAEHRAKQRAAILRAAEEIALEGGARGVTLAAVAARAGLARPSVYAYFPSADAVLATLVLEGFDRWRAALEQASGTARTPDERVHAYFLAVARSAAAGNHRLAAALTGVQLPDEVRTSLLAGHRQTAAPLVTVLRDLHVTEPEDALALMQTVVNHCIARVEAGRAPAAEARRAADFTLGGLERLTGAPSA